MRRKAVLRRASLAAQQRDAQQQEQREAARRLEAQAAALEALRQQASICSGVSYLHVLAKIHLAKTCLLAFF